VRLPLAGFIKDEFLEYCLQEAVRRDVREIIENKSKFLVVHASSGHKHALQVTCRRAHGL
jgi:protein pelota